MSLVVCNYHHLPGCICGKEIDRLRALLEEWCKWRCTEEDDKHLPMCIHHS